MDVQEAAALIKLTDAADRRVREDESLEMFTCNSN